MNKKITGVAASGQTRLEIRPGDIWKDAAGSKITVTDYTRQRVTYIRSGYEHPCVSPVRRFLRDFIPLLAGALPEWCQSNNPLEKTEKLKALITGNRK